MANYNEVEKHIINESPEISVGENRDWARRILKVYPALRNRNYQYYFSGQLVSLVGTWLQTVAQGWLVYKLTNSAYLIGVTAALSTLPTLFFSLFGGVLVDRFSKRKILIFTQVSSMTLAFVLGTLTVFNVVTIWQIMVLAFLLGVVQAIDAPARLSFTVEMVGKEDMSSALSLNAGLFNGARVIGPGIAGFLIAIIGVGGSFLVNGISYIGVIAALLKMRVEEAAHKTHANPIRAVREGIVYSYKHPVVSILLLLAGVTSTFGWSHTTMLPYIAEDTFNLGAWGLGYLYAASGLGAFLATFIVSGYSKKIKGINFIFAGNVIFVIGALLFSFTSNLILALVYLFFAGLGLLVMFSMMNIVIQTIIEDEYRGRVMSIYTIMFLGLSALGNFQIGFFSEHFGTGFAIRLGAIITFVFGVIVFANRYKIRASYQKYKDINGQNG
jgi:MFS family permease